MVDHIKEHNIFVVEFPGWGYIHNNQGSSHTCLPKMCDNVFSAKTWGIKSYATAWIRNYTNRMEASDGRFPDMSKPVIRVFHQRIELTEKEDR